MLTSPFRNLIKRVANKTLQASTVIRTKSTVIDPIQEASLDEKLLLVDENDKLIGCASKRECHFIGKSDGIPLHRAFSVFIFNKNGDLFLQKRSAQKVTFPNCYTNSCCSHPTASVEGEAEEKDALGVKRAAQRRLNYELGIPLEQIPVEKFNYITRIYYKDLGDGEWGEHEIDYVLFIQDDLKLKPNPNEISEISIIPRNELDEFLPTLNAPLTPWFRLILQHRLKLWWDNLDNLDKFKDHQKILRFDKK